MEKVYKEEVCPMPKRIKDFIYDSAETSGFGASPYARSYNKRLSGSRGCTPSAQMLSFAFHFTCPQPGCPHPIYYL